MKIIKTKNFNRKTAQIPPNADRSRSTKGKNSEIIELAFVGPKSSKGRRKFGEYLLPHNLATIDFDLIDNLEYLDRCVVYNLSAGGVHPLLQELRQTFIKYRADHGELIINYNWLYIEEEHATYFAGEVINNIPKKNVSDIIFDFSDAKLILYFDGKKGVELHVHKHLGYELFEVFGPEKHR